MLGRLFSVGLLQLAFMVVLLGRTKFLALWLGPDALGLMAVIDKLVRVFSQTALFSIPIAALRFLPEAFEKSPADFTDLYLRMRRWIVILVVLATGVGVAAALSLPELFGETLSEHRSVIALAFLCLPALMAVPFLQSAFAGRQQPLRAMFFLLLNAIALTTAGIGGAWIWGLHGIYASYAVLGGILCLVFINRPSGLEVVSSVSSLREKLRLRWPVWRLCLCSVPLAFASSFAVLFVHYRVLDILGAEAAGIMHVPLALGIIIGSMLGMGITVLHTPNVSRGGSPEERMALADHYQRVSLTLFAIGAPVVLLLPDVIVPLLYSEEFLPAIRYLMMFILLQAAVHVGQVYQAIVVALDRMTFHVIENVIAQLLVICVALWAIPSLGIPGAALALACEPALLVTCTLIWLRIKEGIAPTLGAVLIWPAVLVQVMLAGWLGVNSSLGIAPRALIACGLASLALTFLPSSERRHLVGLLRHPFRSNRAAK